MQTTPSDAQTPSQASCGGPEASQTLRAGSDLIFHRVCPADQIEEGVGRPITLDGTHLALFRHEDVLHAVDNRCPHMGYPMSEGSVRDGILVCHWHHWEFDVKTGGCLLSGGDDLSTFPVEVRDDGYLYVGIAGDEKEAARRRLIERGKRALEQGLKDRSAFLIAKAVTALGHAGATPQETIQQGIYYGARRSGEGWSSGLAVLTIAANMWNDVDEADLNLFLVHGLTQIGRRTSGNSRRHLFPFPAAEQDPDLETCKRWFRRYVEQRNTGAAERILVTLHDRECTREQIADVVFAAATDYYFTGDGHALDFANKMFEALDYVDWVGANEILRPIVVDLVGRTRHEETSRWADSVPVLTDVFSRLDAIWEDNQGASAELDISSCAEMMLGDDFVPIVAEIESQLRKGVDPLDLCRAMTYAGAIRIARFHLKNEGDWHDVANVYSYAHALHRAFLLAPSRELLRGIFHGAVFMTYLRWLNMPAARLPQPGQTELGGPAAEEDLLDRLQELADFQKVFEAEVVVNQYLEAGYDILKLRHALGHITLREDAELHMFQVLEVAFRHLDLSEDPEEKRMHLLAATRYITAQKVMKGILWSTENAERLQRGELLSEREDDN
ncbi:MAG: Rieske (2Fe-2S) protein [Candidatus Latescibacteria bacterium]|jgi:nitrite reductase/ring-hydroxylating ferredoxin subunit|nr:Rieske (2Fe-2S) protein [Candidatus Latescibacterota bacterium]